MVLGREMPRRGICMVFIFIIPWYDDPFAQADVGSNGLGDQPLFLYDLSDFG